MQRIRLIIATVGGKGMTQIAEQMRTYLPGWKSYFRDAQTPKIFRNHGLLDTRQIAGDPAKHWRVGTTV